MTNQSNPTNENKNRNQEQTNAKTETEQKKSTPNATAKKDGEPSDGQNKGKSTTSPVGQATNQNPQAKTGSATTAQNKTPQAKSQQR